MKTMKLAILLLCTFLPSRARLAIWRLMGFKVGRGCHVSMFSVVVADAIEFGPGAVVEALSLVYQPEFFSMGERSRIASFVRIVGHRGRVLLGAQSFLALGCLVDSTGDFELGDRSQVAPRSTLYSHGTTGLLYNVRYPHRVGKVRIGSDTWLGMGSIVHPQVAIGDRVIVLPGLVIRANVPNDTAVLPPSAEHRTVSTSRLLLGVTDEVRRRSIDELLRECAASFRGSRLDESRSDFWRLVLSGNKTIYLVRDESVAIDRSTMPPASSIVWTLFERGVVPGVPSFCFDRLTVFGQWTPFAERIATFLCRKGGALFVFQGGNPRQKPLASG